MREGKVVAVTGASGYIASYLVKLLLERGYTVKATVRNLNDPTKTARLLSLDGAKERLQLLEADLLQEGSFDSVVDCCVGVFHAASPVIMTSPNPQSDIIEPAVKGTFNVLRSCAKVSSVKRVVLTGSIAAVLVNTRPRNPDVEVDETWFSDPVFCEDIKHWYDLSKTLAEQAARKFAEENGIDLVIIHPGHVIGPTIQPSITLSNKMILDLIKTGQDPFPDGLNRLVDIRDVANAHIQAFEIPSASGRYILVDNATYSPTILKIIHEFYPTLRLSERWKEETPTTPPYKMSKERAKSLGINFTPLEVSLRDTIECFREKNLLSF